MRPLTMLAMGLGMLAGVLGGTQPCAAQTAAEIDREATAALKRLYATEPAARTLGKAAKGILVFPTVGKGGFIFAGQYGTGALRKGGRTAGYYSIAEVSYGFQAGIQKFSYALFFMTDGALTYLDKTGGFEVGAGPSLTVVDKGFASQLGTTASRSDVYAFVFGQKGLMGGIGLRGSKITRVHPKK